MDLASLASELNPDAIPEVDLAKLPENKAGRRQLLYPGAYNFTLPGGFDFGKDDTGERQLIYANFSDAYALTAQPGGKQWTGRLYNRPRTKKVGWGKDAKEVATNDLAELLKAVGHVGTLATNAAYAEALSKYPGAKFGADISWSVTCSPKKNIWAEEIDPETGDSRIKEQAGKVGCGRTYISDEGYTRKRDGVTIHSIPKDDNGAWAARFTCSCGAALSANDNLNNIRGAKK